MNYCVYGDKAIEAILKDRSICGTDKLVALIIGLVAGNGGVSQKEIMAFTGLSRTTVWYTVHRLMDYGIIYKLSDPTAPVRDGIPRYEYRLVKDRDSEHHETLSDISAFVVDDVLTELRGED